MKPKMSTREILDELASQQQRGQTSCMVTIEPSLMEEAMSALHGYRTLFAPVIAGQTDLVPIYANYERMREAELTRQTILLLVECRAMEEYREALRRMPIRHSSEWRSADDPEFWERYLRGIHDSNVE